MTTYPLPVARKLAEGRDGASIWLDVPQDLTTVFAYRAGQFITVETDIDGEKLTRQYSLSSTPEHDHRLRITVKKVPQGRVSTWLVDEVSVGQFLDVASPRGLFFKPLEQPRHVLLFSAGSGVAPMVPIARTLLEKGSGHIITFVCGNRTEQTIMLREEVSSLDEDPAVTVEHVLSRANNTWKGPKGRIDRAYLEGHLPNWLARSDLPISAWLCGPEGFMDVIESVLMGFGVEETDIRHESFDLVLNDDDDTPSLMVTSQVSGVEGPCELITAVVGGREIEMVPEEGESILDTILRTDADVPFSCQEGTCSSCISKLTEGSALVRAGVLQTLREDDLEEGLVLACLASPTTQSVRIDFDEI